MESQILIIFGASGDLTKRKLIPALYELSQQGLIPEKFAVLGVSRSAISDEDFRQRMTEFLPQSGESSPDVERFLRRLSYLALQTGEPAEYERLKKTGRDMTSTYGAEKKPAIGKMRSLIHRLAGLSMTKLLIHQEKPAWVGGEINGVVIDGWDRINYVMDVVIHVVRSGQQRIAKVERSRMQQFPEGLTFPWSYAEFAQRLHSQPTKPDVVEDTVADDAGVVATSGTAATSTDNRQSANGTLDDLRRLIRDTQTPIEVIDRWLTKTGAASWDDVPAELVDKCINHLAAEKETIDKQ